MIIACSLPDCKPANRRGPGAEGLRAKVSVHGISKLDDSSHGRGGCKLRCCTVEVLGCGCAEELTSSSQTGQQAGCWSVESLGLSFQARGPACLDTVQQGARSYQGAEELSGLGIRIMRSGALHLGGWQSSESGKQVAAASERQGA